MPDVNDGDASEVSEEEEEEEEDGGSSPSVSEDADAQ